MAFLQVRQHDLNQQQVSWKLHRSACLLQLWLEHGQAWVADCSLIHQRKLEYPFQDQVAQ